MSVHWQHINSGTPLWLWKMDKTATANRDYFMAGLQIFSLQGRSIC